MQIPDEILDEAEDLRWDGSGEYHGFGNPTESYEHVAEWAREAALKEAVTTVRGLPLSPFGESLVVDAIQALRTIEQPLSLDNR